MQTDTKCYLCDGDLAWRLRVMMTVTDGHGTVRRLTLFSVSCRPASLLRLTDVQDEACEVARCTPDEAVVKGARFGPSVIVTKAKFLLRLVKKDFNGDVRKL